MRRMFKKEERRRRERGEEPFIFQGALWVGDADSSHEVGIRNILSMSFQDPLSHGKSEIKR